MKTSKEKFFKAYPLILLTAFALFLGVNVSGDDDLYEKINRNMGAFGVSLQRIALNYVDEIDADKFIQGSTECLQL